MTLREFFRYHLLKVLLALVVVQLGIVAFVQNFNHRPVAQTDRTTVFAGHKVSISPLTNDSDKDEEDEITLNSVDDPINGTVEKIGNAVQYIPADDFYGLDSFAYTITDGDKISKTSYIVVQVDENLKPETMADSVVTYSDMNIKVSVLGNDSDREGDSIFIAEFSQPVHGEVVLKNDCFYYSTDPSFTGSDSFSYIISDGKKNSSGTSVFMQVKNKNEVCYPWLSDDIGNTALKGNLTCSNGNMEIRASGEDIWNQEDGFYFVYQYVTGDCELTAKVESLEGTHEWAKAGLMIRESLYPGSKDAIVLVSARNGVTYHQRTSTNASKEGGENIPDLKAPYWLKILRKGNAFFYYASENGKNWKLLKSTEIKMTEDVFIGMAVTSHNNDELAKAVFNNVKVLK